MAKKTWTLSEDIALGNIPGTAGNVLVVDGVKEGSVTLNLRYGTPSDSDIHGDGVRITIIKVELTVTDLDGVVADDKEDSPGAFLHFNIDDDNASYTGATVPPRPKRPGADSLEIGASQVANEDDLKPLGMSLAPVLAMGFAVLTIGNDRAKVWKHERKGSANLVLAGSGSRSWDLADADPGGERGQFVALVASGVHVEGVGTGSCAVRLAFRTTATGTDVAADTVNYVFLAADCGDQHFATGNDEAGDSERVTFRAFASGLIDCEWSVLSPDPDGSVPDLRFNCLASSVDVYDIHEFYAIKKGWKPVGNGVHDCEAVYFGDGSGTNLHAARRRSCTCGGGTWLMFDAKCGAYERIEFRHNQMVVPYGTGKYYHK